MLDEGSWMHSDYIGASISPSAYRYSVPPAMGNGRSNVSPGVAVSIEEKVSDLIESYPHLKALLKSHSRDGNARLRDLEISSQELTTCSFRLLLRAASNSSPRVRVGRRRKRPAARSYAAASTKFGAGSPRRRG